MQTQNYTHSHNLPQWKKMCYWHRRLIPPSPKQTHKRKLPCFSHPENTQHLNVIAKAGQAFIGIDVKRRSHCDTPSVGEGRGGSHGRPPAVRSICVGDAAALGPSACGGDGSLTGASASMDQLPIRCTCVQKHARVHVHSLTPRHPWKQIYIHKLENSIFFPLYS